MPKCKHKFNKTWGCWCGTKHRCCSLCHLPLGKEYRKNFLKETPAHSLYDLERVRRRQAQVNT